MSSGHSRIAYQPALDGLRAVALISVLLFHGGFGWASGGYLGVSVFFTISGYLITSLLLEEISRTGRLALGAFYARRCKRLLPAAAVCVVGVVALVRAKLIAAGSLRGDVVWTAFDLANWHQLWAGQSYASIFASPAPLQHFWSLAIEEQFYLAWPVLCLALVVLVCLRRPERFVPVAVGLFLVSAVVAPVLAHVQGPNAAYLSTFARASELLAGVALAAMLRTRSVPRAIGWVGLVAAPAIVFAMVATPAGSGWPYRGGLPAFAVASALVIAGVQVDGPLRRGLAVPPLVWVGRLSYGLYLYHWPLFLVLTPARVGLHGVALFGVRVLATFAVAWVSYVAIEQPIRRADRTPRLVLALAAALVLFTASSAVLVHRAPAVAFDTADLDQRQLAAVAIQPPPSSDASSSVPTSGHSSTSVVPRPRRVLIIGDSTAVALGSGVVQWALANSGTAQVTIDAHGACGVVRGGHYQDRVLDSALQFGCADFIWTKGPALVSDLQPDLVVLMITSADVWPRSWDGGTTWLRTFQPPFSQRVRDDYGAYIDALVKAGAHHIAWVRPPTTMVDQGGRWRVEDSFRDGSQQVIEDEIRRLEVAHPDVLTTLDLRTWFDASALASDHSARPDGLHLTVPAATRVASDWFGPQLVSLTDEAVRQVP